MIDTRIRFALDVLERNQGPAEYVLRSGIAIDRSAIADFLKIVDTSIFEQNHNIARFIDALCFGNMRQALDMFTTFMTSGATDVDKMLAIYRQSGSYFVAFHEFVKSIMLGERRYYKDEASPIMNVFDCGADKNSSHFTALRIMRALSERRGESTREGQGFHEKASLCQQKSFTRAIFLGDRARGLALLRGGAAGFAAWGEPARPSFPFWGNGKGELKIPSLLPQAMNSVYSRFNPSLHNRRFALLPFALFVEQLAPVPVGVLNILFGCCHLKLRTELSPRRKSFRLDLAVTRTRRFAKN
jgi:hypothetical protein